MPEYIYLIHPFREGFFEQMRPEEETVMQAHFDYLRQAAENGIVLLAGSCLDDTFGLVLFRAESDHLAQVFMMNDPSVKQNVMMAELHPLRISLPGSPSPQSER